MDKFAERLKQLRTERGFYQRDIGEALGVSTAIITEYESGRKCPAFPRFIELCKFLDVSSDYLLGLSDDPKHR